MREYVTPLLKHWSYVFLALTYQNIDEHWILSVHLTLNISPWPDTTVRQMFINIDRPGIAWQSPLIGFILPRGIYIWKCGMIPHFHMHISHGNRIIWSLTLSQCTLAGPVYTGMPLECHWLTQCTLEHHWKNLVETAPHWNATGES